MQKHSPNCTRDDDVCHLCASAEDLLEACKMAFINLNERSLTNKKWNTSDQYTFDLLDIAISKAEGKV